MFLFLFKFQNLVNFSSHNVDIPNIKHFYSSYIEISHQNVAPDLNIKGGGRGVREGASAPTKPKVGGIAPTIGHWPFGQP